MRDYGEPMVERVPYDEFSMFGDNAAEYDIAYPGPPTVRRESVEVGGGRKMSALVWASRAGATDPEIIFIHGGAGAGCCVRVCRPAGPRPQRLRRATLG